MPRDDENKAEDEIFEFRTLRLGPQIRGATCSTKRRSVARVGMSGKLPRAKFPATSVKCKRSRTCATLSRTSATDKHAILIDQIVKGELAHLGAMFVVGAVGFRLGYALG